MQLLNCITLNGEATEAFEFYKDCFGAESRGVMRYGDTPAAAGMPEDVKKLILHAELVIDSFVIFLSDSSPGNIMTGGDKVSIGFTDVSEKSVDHITAIYKKLKHGGKVLMELEPTFFSKAYAWVEDKYGVHWQLMAATPDKQ
jgi:PhnB protein